MEEVVNLAALEGSVDFSMFGMFLKSDWVVKLVIILLVIFSIQSWKIIIQKILLINKQRKISKQFENHFWSGISLDELHQQIDDFDQESFLDQSHLFVDAVHLKRCLTKNDFQIV